VDWNHAKDIAETVESILKSIGLLVAAAWAYWRFFLQAERETSISSKLQVAVLPCEESGHRLLEVRSTLTNNGKVPCQIDLSQSTLRVSHVRLDVQDNGVSWDTKLYFEKALRTSRLNVPVGASMDDVEFVPVPHPGIYHVRTFFAQTERDMEIFYKRLGEPLPQDPRNGRSGWPNAAVISTHSPNTVSMEQPTASISKADRANTPDSV
jgi:hypothetical protein